MMAKSSLKIARGYLEAGGVVVMPTDTIYSVLGSALNPKTVERIYSLRKRNPKKLGPLVAPSANLEGMPPARTIGEAKKYFRRAVDFYVDGGVRRGRSSKLIKFVNGRILTLR